MSFRPRPPHLEVRDQEGERIELSHEVRMRARHLERQAEELGQHTGELERLTEELEQMLADEARRRTELEEEIRRLRARVKPDAGRQ